MEESKRIEKLLCGSVPFGELSNNHEDSEERRYKITGTPQQLDALEQVFFLMNQLGSEGHSSEIRMGYDGDGNARMQFKRIGKEKLAFPRDHLVFYIEKNNEQKRIDFKEFLRLLAQHGDSKWVEGEDKFLIYHDYDDSRDDDQQYFDTTIL